MYFVTSPSNHPPVVGKLTPDQIASRSTWTGVPDRSATLAAMHVIRVVPAGSTTVTHLNPLDPATIGEVAYGETSGWYEGPAAAGSLHPAGRVW